MVSALEKRGVLAATLVVVVADHGVSGKESCNSAGMVVPLVMRLPSLIEPRGVIADQIGSHVDLLPTILDAAGPTNLTGEPYGVLAAGDGHRRDVDGISLLPLIAWPEHMTTRAAWEGDDRHLFCEMSTDRAVYVAPAGATKTLFLDLPLPFSYEAHGQSGDRGRRTTDACPRLGYTPAHPNLSRPRYTKTHAYIDRSRDPHRKLRFHWSEKWKNKYQMYSSRDINQMKKNLVVSGTGKAKDKSDEPTKDQLAAVLAAHLEATCLHPGGAGVAVGESS